MARPPVPLLRQPNPVLETALSRGEPARATSTPAPETPPVTVLRPLADTATKAIEADGYKRVRVTERDANGNWRGRAFRGETEVAVSVDDAGNVSLQ